MEKRAECGASIALDMPRVDAIWRHPVYREQLIRIEKLERDRRFCRHGLTHLLDVARIMWIAAWEEGLTAGLSRDVVYAAALLHDIGRAAQYEMEEPHDIAGVRIAREIMGTVDDGCAFSDAEQELIADAIGAHRDGTDAVKPLARLLYRADKLSRPCFACPARPECNWPEEQQNLTICV